MPDEDHNKGVRENVDRQLVWQIWVSEPLNKDAYVLVKWSRTSFFGSSPVSMPKVFDGKEYALFQKCSEEWTVKYALATALTNYRHVRLTKRDEEISLEPYLKEIPRPSGNILGDAASMGRSGGIC